MTHFNCGVTRLMLLAGSVVDELSFNIFLVRINKVFFNFFYYLVLVSEAPVEVESHHLNV